MLQWPVLLAVFVGGTIAGALDIAFALSFAAYNGVGPLRLLQTVASGALGNAAFGGGLSTAVLGLAFHFGISYLWAALFVGIAWHFPRTAHRPLLSGVSFGVAVFLTMRCIVLPLSAFPRPVTFAPLATILDLLSHTLLFGVPIAVVASKALARKPRTSFNLDPHRG
jgi:uncharacterized membrane protein YagU involved in acid resistance